MNQLILVDQNRKISSFPGNHQIRPSAKVESARARLNRTAESSKRSQNISLIAWMEATPVNKVSVRLKTREPCGR